MFGIDLNWWDSDIVIRRKFTVTDPSDARIAGKITYMGCNDQTCSPPSDFKFDKPVPKKSHEKIMLMAAIVLSALLSSLSAQILNPVRWEVSSEMTSPTEGVIRYSATIEPGWHLYGTTLPDGGPQGYLGKL